MVTERTGPLILPIRELCPTKAATVSLAVPSGLLMLWDRCRTPSQEELRVKSFWVKNMNFGAKPPGYQSCLCSY